MRQIVHYIKPYWKQALIAPLLMVLEVTMDLMQPRMMQRIVDEGIRYGNQSIVLETGFFMIVFALIGAVGGIGCTIYTIRAGVNTGADLRKSVYEKISSLSFGNLDQLGTGDLVTRLTNDVTQIQDIIMIVLRVLVRVPLIGVGSLIMALLTSPQLAMISLVLIVPIAVVLWFVIRRAYPLYSTVQSSLDRVNTVIQENLSGVRVVKAFVRENHEEQRFHNVNADLKTNSIRAMNLTIITNPVMLLLLNIGTAAVLWFGGIQSIAGDITVGEIIAVITYISQMLSTLVMVSMILMRLSRAWASTDRIVEVLNSSPDVEDKPSAIQDFNPKGRVAFENVTFGYGEPILKNVSFVAEPGQTVAILGSTGSGKTSLIHLIPRFYDVTEGRVTIDGVDVRDVAQSALRQSIGISLQEAVLFSGTVTENLHYGNPTADDETIQEVIRIAQAQDFVDNLADRYETKIGQRGVNFSGGQKQRMAIARALIRRPAILILDDSTSAVDMETESRLLDELDTFMDNRTSFIVAQRISTVLRADKILVLDNGLLVAEGTHQDLIKSSDIYRQIYESQLGSPEDVPTEA